MLQIYFSHLLFLKHEHSFVASDYTERGSGSGLQLIISHLEDFFSTYGDYFDDEMSSAFLLWLEGMNIATLVQVVNILSKTIVGINSSASRGTDDDGEVVPLRGKQGSAIFDLFLEACKMVASAPGHEDASCEMHVVSLEHSFIMLGNKELLHKLVDNIVDGAKRDCSESLCT